MFGHIYFYRLKTLFRDRESLFWTLLFPVALGTFFYLGLSGISGADTFQAIPAAVIADEALYADTNFQALLDAISTGDNPLLNLTETDEDAAVRMLREGDIAAYIKAGAPPTLVAARSGFGASVVQLVLNDYVQSGAAVTSIITANPGAMPDVFEAVGNREAFLKRVPISRNEADPLLNYFYVLLAMACFYGSLLGQRVIREIQASHSQLAARIGVAPPHKMMIFLASALATLTVQVLQMGLLLLFLEFVLPLNLGDQAGYIILATVLGSITGLAYGCFIASLTRKSEGVTVAILIGTTMLASFLSGMMFANMKYIIQKNVPWLSRLNPISLLTDAYYSLNYFDSHQRYWTNMAMLAGFAVLFMALTYLLIRRRRYASI